MRDMQVHVKVLGAMYIAFAALGLLFACLIGLGFGGTIGIVGASGDPDAAIAIPILGALGTLLVGVVAILSLPGLIAGMGLLYLKSWARILGIVLAALCLLGFPWFTILGAYGLWVLLSKDSEHLFDQSTSAITPAR